MLGGTIGQYRVTRLIGQGGMGAVYAGEHALLGRIAAIKVLLPEFTQNQDIVNRFFNEAKATTAIQHPGIVEIFDFGWNTDGSAYIVMELLRGESLATRMGRQRMSWNQSLALVRQIAGALAAAHARNIVHRDLKPDNIYLIPDPEVPGGERIKLLDFGIAKLAGDSNTTNKTRTGSVMGTPTYMAPEQCRGVAVDHRADLYALGCILFEMCAGRPPFVGEGAGDVLAAHIHVPPPTVGQFVAGVAPELEGLIQHLLAKQPAQRVGSAEELIRTIDAMSNSAFRTGPQLPSHPNMQVSVSAPTTLSGAAHARPGTVPAVQGTSRTPLVAGLSLVAAAGVAIAIVLSRGSGGGDAPAEPVAAKTPEVAKVETPPPTPAPAPKPDVTPEPPKPDVPPEPPKPEPTPASAAKVDPAAPALVAISFESKPAGAQVLVDGKVLGQTPFTSDLPQGDAELKVVFRKPGYRDKTVTMRATAAATQSVKLDVKRSGGGGRDQSVNPFGP